MEKERSLRWCHSSCFDTRHTEMQDGEGWVSQEEEGGWGEDFSPFLRYTRRFSIHLDTYPLILITEEGDEEGSEDIPPHFLRADTGDGDEDVCTGFPYSPDCVFTEALKVWQLRREC